ASDTGYLLTYVSQMAYLEFDQALEPLDIDARQYGVMTLIDNGTHLSQIAISEKLGFDRTHVVRLVDDLEEIKYVLREKDPNDRRYYRLVLTEKGKAVLEEAKVRAAAAQDETYSCFSPEERETLNRLLRKLGNHRQSVVK
ncbi:MAG: MarR family transcriptional regulator, partial [Chloroflexota bacterium]